MELKYAYENVLEDTGYQKEAEFYCVDNADRGGNVFFCKDTIKVILDYLKKIQQLSNKHKFTLLPKIHASYKDNIHTILNEKNTWFTTFPCRD